MEESWAAGDTRPKIEFMEIKGKRGYIRPWGESELELYVQNVTIANRIEREYKQFKLKNSYDDGAAFVFSPDLLPLAVRLIRARKRRQMTPEQRARNAETLATWRSKLRKASINDGLDKQNEIT